MWFQNKTYKSSNDVDVSHRNVTLRENLQQKDHVYVNAQRKSLIENVLMFFNLSTLNTLY